MVPHINRRKFIAASGAAGIGSIAGCIGEDAVEDEENGEGNGNGDEDELGDADPDEGGEIIAWHAGGTGGTYYPLSGNFKSIIEEHTPHGVQVQSTGASLANVGSLHRGEADFALIQNDIAYFAYHGTDHEELEGNPMENLRGVATLYPETIHIITQEGSGIETVEDLEGQTVNTGDAGSGTQVNALQILETAGVEDFNEQNTDFDSAADQVRDGDVDAAFVVGGWPVGSIEDLATNADIEFVEVSGDVREDVMDEAEWFAEDTIPGGTYGGVDDDVETVSVQAMIATHADVEDDLGEGAVEEITEAIFENTDGINHKADFIDAESAQDGMPIELHPGADAYFN